MVRREEFDEILLNNSVRSGAHVTQLAGNTDLDVLQTGDRVTGVTVKDPAGVVREYTCDMVFDCSGYSAFLARKFNLRSENRLNRMAIFGHYKTVPLNEDVKKGWFVGQMVYDGWIWLIPLKPDLISIGLVIPVEEYKKAQQSPQAFLEHYMATTPIVPPSIRADRQLEGKMTRLRESRLHDLARARQRVGPGRRCGVLYRPVLLVGSSSRARWPRAVHLFLESRRTGKPQTDMFAA
jgi:flavin-dependent dehydrogenase